MLTPAAHHARTLPPGLLDGRRVSTAIMASTKRRTFSHAHKQWLDRAAEVFLQDCYAKRTPARVADFAAALELNPEYLTRTSASISGATLLTVLRTQQLNEAERLLTTTQLTVAEIAVAAAFGDPTTLWRSFKRYRNTSPSEVRKVRKCTNNA